MEETVLPMMGRGSVFLGKLEKFHSIAGPIQLLFQDEEIKSLFAFVRLI